MRVEKHTHRDPGPMLWFDASVFPRWLNPPLLWSESAGRRRLVKNLDVDAPVIDEARNAARRARDAEKRAAREGRA